MDGRVAVEFGGETCNHGFRERPWLAAKVFDVLDADSCFFHGFALNGLLQRFANFYESRNEEHTRFVGVVQVAGHQKFIAVANCDDDDRRNFWIDGVLAARANHSTFAAATFHEASAFTAEFVQVFPLGDVCCSGAAEAFQVIRKCAECTVAAELISVWNFGQVRVAQEVRSVVDANQVMAFALRKIAHSRDFVVVAILFE